MYEKLCFECLVGNEESWAFLSRGVTGEFAQLVLSQSVMNE